MRRLLALFAVVVVPLACGQAGASVAPWIADRGDGTYRNPIIDADYSDPDAIRVGDDYWMISSSFGHVPAIPVLHSRDLINWRLVAHALPRLVPEDVFSRPQHGKGVWAPAIRHHAGKFWIYYPDPDFGLYVITADDPRGPWSAPAMVKAGRGLIDPCPFWDDDGQIYLIHALAASRAGHSNVLHLLRLDASGTQVVEDLGVVIDGNKLPRYRVTEGPKLYKRNGWYYVFAPSGGVKQGWQSVFRARDIRGPYEDRITLEQGRTAINGPHQGALVDTPSGEWWFLHFQDKDVFGRVVHLNPVRWVDDWPVMGDDPEADGRGEPVATHRKPDLPVQPVTAPATTDEFDGPEPGLQWQWQANPGPGWAKVADGRLVLAPQPPAAPNLWSAPHLLMQKFPTERFVATARIRAGRDSRIGLVVFGFDYAWLGLERSAAGNRLVLKRCRKAADGRPDEEVFAVAVPDAGAELRVEVGAGARCTFSYRTDDGAFHPIDAEFVAQESRWVGAKVGLFAEGLGAAAEPAAADWFRVEGAGAP